MSPLGVRDPLDHDLTRRRMVAAAAAYGWAVRPGGRDPARRDPGGRGDGYPRRVRHPGGCTVLRRRPVRPFAARTLVELEPGSLAPVENHPRFAALPAVRAGRYLRLDPAASYAVCVPSVLTVPLAVGVLESVLG